MGNYITKTAEKIRPEGLSKTREVYPGDLILSNSMSFGKPYIMGIYGCIHDGWLLIRNEKETFDLTFLCHLLGTTQMLEQYRSFAAGSTVNNLNKELVGSTIVKYPSMQEQKVIGTYFNMIDNLITLHQRKYEKLTNIKKSLLEKMFPTGDENVPKLRFKGFTSPWEQRKLGEITKITMGQSPNGINYTTNPNDAILVQGNADMTDGWVLPRVYTKQITKKAYSGDLIFSVRAPVGEVGKTQYNVVIGRGVAAISGNEFIYQCLKRMNIFGFWSKLSSGSTFESINSDTLKTVEFFIPKEKEQTTIGEFLSKLDNLITLHQRMLEKLKNIKKSLLEKMFV